VVIEDGAAVINAEGEPEPLPVLDDAGVQLLNEAGEPVFLHRLSATHIFIHEDSAYFD
jgi:hypothetical protein